MIDSPDGGAARELRAETTIAAPPERVWALVTDFDRLAEWSPELVKMVALKPGGLRPGQWYFGLNRRKAVFWPTRSVVAQLVPSRLVAWDTKSSGARWIWELEGVGDGGSTRVVHRRPVPRQITLLSRVFAPTFLGGNVEHADELEANMQRTVDRLKAAAEG